MIEGYLFAQFLSGFPQKDVFFMDRCFPNDAIWKNISPVFVLLEKNKRKLYQEVEI